MLNNPFKLLLHVPVPWVFILTYLCGVVLELVCHSKVHAPDSHATSTIAGGVLFALGALVAGWSWLIFYKARTTTVPRKGVQPVDHRGPYRFSRNPMYVGLSLAYLGEAGLLHQVWPVLLLPLTIVYINWVVIPVEEARLKEVFALDYQTYCAKVRRWF